MSEPLSGRGHGHMAHANSSILLALMLCAAVLLMPVQVRAQDNSGNWSEPAELSQEKWAWRPVAAVDPAQVVHVLWPCMESGEEGAEGRDAAFYTRWDGEAWSAPVDVLVSPGGGGLSDPAMTADAAGNLHVVWSDGVSLFYSRAAATDAGSARGWTPARYLASGQYAEAAIAADGAGTVHVVYPDPTDGVFYLSSTDGGRSWSWPVRIWSAREGQVGAGAVRLAVDDGLTVHVVWTLITLPNGYPPLGVVYSQSTDGGQTWAAPLEVAGEDYGEGNVLAADGGEIHLTWHGRVGVGGTFYQESADGGRTWSEPVRLLEGGGLTRAPALAVDSAGTLHLAAISADGLAYLYRQGESWSEPAVIDAWSKGYEPHHPFLAVSGGNRLFLLWGTQGDAHGTGVVRYASRRTLAPYAPPTVLQTASPVPTVTAAATARPAATPTSVPNPVSIPAGGEMPDEGSAIPLIVGVAPAVLLVLLVILLRGVRGGRR